MNFIILFNNRLFKNFKNNKGLGYHSAFSRLSIALAICLIIVMAYIGHNYGSWWMGRHEVTTTEAIPIMVGRGEARERQGQARREGGGP